TVDLAQGRVVDVDRVAVELEVALVALPAGRAAVDDTTRVAKQVERLRRLPHHPEQQPARREIRLARADARPAVPPQRSEHAQLAGAETLLAERGELGTRLGKFGPGHDPYCP